MAATSNLHPGTSGGVRDLILDFELGLEQVDGYAVVSLKGELDLATAPQLKTALTDLVSDGQQQICLDMAELQFIDSTGLNVIVGAVKEVEAAGGRLVLRSPTPATYKVFQITGLAAVLPVEDPPVEGSTPGTA